jgi:hypothetical protein
VHLAIAQGVSDLVVSASGAELCGGEQGLGSTVTYREGALAYELHSCAFMKHDRYHRCAYAVPRGQMAQRGPLLHRICESVELLR